MIKKEILAHLGTIPFKMHLNGKIFDAQWWMDFSVHPNYRRQGLGKLLTKKCMEYSLTFKLLAVMKRQLKYLNRRIGINLIIHFII